MKKEIKTIIPICILATIIPATPVHALLQSEIVEKAIPVEYSEYKAIGDGYILLEKLDSGFSDSTWSYGVYDYINQQWLMEYQSVDDYIDKANYAGDGIFAFSKGGTTFLLDTATRNIAELDLTVSPEELQFYNGHAVVDSQRTDGYRVFVVDKDGESYATRVTDTVSHDDSQNLTYLRHCFTNENYAVYIYDRTDFMIYNIEEDIVSDIYSPEFADKMSADFRDNLSCAVCGDDYLALMNMEGNDGKNYYAALDFTGNAVIDATQCDYATITERGNILVRNNDQTEEISLADLAITEEQELKNLALVSWNQDSREERTIAMDRTGNLYKDAMEYHDIFYIEDAPEYCQADTWYLGGNYSKFQGVWYFPEGTREESFVNVRLVGDGNVIYESGTLNAQNAKEAFDVDVSGVKELRLEYDGETELNGLLLGLADAKLTI